MKSIYTSTLVAVTALLGTSNVMAYTTTSDGCYSSTTGLTSNGTNTFNSVGYCSNQCLGMAMAVMAMKDSACYCGQDLPPTSMVADNSSCSTSCPGYPSDICGGIGVYSVYLTGLTTDVTHAAPAASDTSSSSSAAKATSKPSTTASASPSVVTVGGQTVVVTASSEATGSSTASSSSSSSSGPSKAGIAAGVVIGIVAIAAIAGGAYIFVRNKRRREVEEEYRRNAAVSSFIGGSKPPTSSGGASSFTDTRLDPAVMAQRRMSDGSIADNQDYSRRILKVTNA